MSWCFILDSTCFCIHLEKHSFREMNVSSNVAVSDHRQCRVFSSTRSAQTRCQMPQITVYWKAQASARGFCERSFCVHCVSLLWLLCETGVFQRRGKVCLSLFFIHVNRWSMSCVKFFIHSSDVLSWIWLTLLFSSRWMFHSCINTKPNEWMFFFWESTKSLRIVMLTYKTLDD